MTTADQVERYVGRTAKTARVDTQRIGKHRADHARVTLGLRRLFYVARHRNR
jgi:hypothetical protein